MARAVPLGITTFVTDQGIDPVQLAREVEARGFHSLYISEHTHIPASRRKPLPIGDGTLLEEYRTFSIRETRGANAMFAVPARKPAGRQVLP